MRLQHTLLLLTTAFTVVRAEIVAYEDCGSKLTVNSVSVDPCPTTPCVLKRGGSATMSIVFQGSENAGLPGDAEVQGIKWGMNFPFELDAAQICEDIRPSCPLRSGRWYTYTKTVSIASWYPAVSGTIRWRLKNTNGDSMVCVEFPAELA
ncbi:Niemann-Pick C2 protein [Clonorchis sinensis]|uniref:Niemann-Pick C2 protein n=1 Tax=Clonorchis sinensis TaxID=79923 RepID=G7YQZ4_CLOSI|nr:Niemann-Pick C2 protein [Clonorchis sinensis]